MRRRRGRRRPPPIELAAARPRRRGGCKGKRAVWERQLVERVGSSAPRTP
jgi:hypothetical protein